MEYRESLSFVNKTKMLPKTISDFFKDITYQYKILFEYLRERTLETMYKIDKFFYYNVNHMWNWSWLQKLFFFVYLNLYKFTALFFKVIMSYFSIHLELIVFFVLK